MILQAFGRSGLPMSSHAFAVEPKCCNTKRLLQRSTICQELRPSRLRAALAATRGVFGLENTNLPHQVTSFIGREREINEIKRLLTATRLLTLTGAGGVGKTRLAVQVAADLVETCINGVWFIELAPLADSALVPQAVAAVLGVREQPGQPVLHSLKDHLRSKDILLVLDNCEHLIDACARLTDNLLHACPNLRILATSREALGISGETTWAVPSLSLPGVQDPRPTFAELPQYEAVQLFVERAVAMQPSFKLTALNASAVAQVCQRLDGIPLAIELAAARVKVLKTSEIAARLDDRFHLLTISSRTALPRHQTLRAAIDWSYDLLTLPERVLLQRLSVFAGGCTLQAAEQVCTDQPERDGIFSSQILDLLARLVDKSLVVVDKQGGDTRYQMLETIREYAREKLLQSGEAERIQNQHLAFFTLLAESADEQLYTEQQVFLLNQLEREHDNLRAALSWSLSPKGNSRWGLRLACALAYFWEVRGYHQEGHEFLGAAFAQNPPDRTELHAKALEKIGFLKFMQGDYPAGRSFLDASLDVYRELGSTSRRRLAHTLRLRGYLEVEVGEYETASELILQALDIMRELNDERGIMTCLSDLGACSLRAGEYARASEYLEEALLLSRGIDPRRRAMTLSGLSELALRQANLDRALELEEESLVLRREIGDKWGIAVSLGNLAWIALKQGDLDRTDTLLEESIAIRRQVSDPGGIAWCLEKMAQVALLKALLKSARQRHENLQRAAHLFGAANALRKPGGSVIDLIDQPEHEAQLAVVREQLGAATFKIATEEGEAMTLEQAIEYALELPPPRKETARPQTARQAAKQEFGGLTERERQVAALIAQGDSNREIAEELVLSERTIETHVENIFNKLGFTSRAQVRKWAAKKGLARTR